MAADQNYTSNPHKTILTIVAGLVLIYLYLDYRGKEVMMLIYISAGLSVLALVSHWLAEKIEWAWMKLAWVLSFFIPNILLTIIFFFFLFPLSLLSRIFKKNDPLMLRKSKTSTFTEVKHKLDPASFEKPW